MKKLRLALARKFSDEQKRMIYSSLGDQYEIYDQKTNIGLSDAALASSVRDVEGLKKQGLIQLVSAGIDEDDYGHFYDAIVCRTVSHCRYVSEYAVSMMMSLIKKLNMHDLLIRQGVRYDFKVHCDSRLYESTTLIGKKIGFLGFGTINRGINKLLAGYDIEPYVFSRYKKSDVTCVALEELFDCADHIFCALPNTAETKDLISLKHFMSLKRTSCIVNVGRQEVFKEKDLVEALEKGIIGGFATDVWKKGTDTHQKELFKYGNTLLGSHRAGVVGTEFANLKGCIENLKRFARGEELLNVVEGK